MPCPSRHSLFRAFPALAASAVLVALLAAPAAATELYQWKDANGVTHYSDSPPPNQGGVKNRVIKNKSGTATSAQSATEDSPAENAQCTTARGNLKQLQSSASVGVDANKDGKPDNILDAQQRAAQVQLAESAVKAYCMQPAAPAVAPASTRPSTAKQGDA
ncbi:MULTISPECIES: DUF4124 domain-containing protein [Lysobacter]|uniref:DUF4124 domain-containing protein n=1 Tax=Lysobacter TaxID=68 RepID=UPI0009DDD54F|nr:MULTISPECIES: DUF4124 domain-containing protein [Lysobacter]